MTIPKPHRQAMRSTIRAIGLVCLLLVSVAISAKPRLMHASNAEIHPLAQRHSATTTTAASTPLELTVLTPAGPLNLRLQRAAAMTTHAGPWVSAIRNGKTRIYRGQIIGQPDSWVRMTQIDGAWLGVIRTRDQLWLLDPARDHPQVASATAAGSNGTLIFTYDDMDGVQQIDLGGKLPPPGALPIQRSPHLGAKPSPRVNGNVNYYLGVSVVMDTEFQAQYGANAASTAVGILNIVDGFYSAQVNTEVYLVAIKALSSNGTLTSTDIHTLLDAFTSYLDDAPIAFSGAIHLFSGRDFDDNLLGVAWLGKICDPRYGSGVDQATFSAAGSGAVVAHELGHNYGAHHDGEGTHGNFCSSSGFIMEPGIGLDNPPTLFSSCSLVYFHDVQTSVSNPRQCLSAWPDVIFSDGFQ